MSLSKVIDREGEPGFAFFLHHLCLTPAAITAAIITTAAPMIASTYQYSSAHGFLSSPAVDLASVVGTGVGAAVGDSVGLAVGSAVGKAVGDSVGLAVGAAVGFAVGPAVGFAVGDSVAVGKAVGELVGQSWSVAQSPR